MVVMAMSAMAMVVMDAMVLVGNRERDSDASVDAGVLKGDRSLFDIISVVSFAAYVIIIMQTANRLD